jgi:hypothetical protein
MMGGVNDKNLYEEKLMEMSALRNIIHVIYKSNASLR